MATITLDDSLVERGRRIGGHRTKKDAGAAALEECVQKRRQQRILDLAGKIEYEPGFDYKALRRRSPKP